MDGKYQNKKEFLKDFLKAWVNNQILNSLWEKMDHLHIDDIDNEFEDRECWLDVCLYIRRLLLEFIDGNQYDLLLAIPLKENEKPSDMPENVNEINKKLSHTPPSFYLFPKKDNRIRKTLDGAIRIDKISNCLYVDIFYVEELDDNFYYRTIFVLN